MIQKIFGLLIIMCISIPFAHDTLISTAISYSSGIIHMNADSDTVSFSNGVKIFSLVFTSPVGIPEDTTWFGGIAFSNSSGKIVYKNDSSLITQGSSMGSHPVPEVLSRIHMALWTTTIGNSDTMWSFAPRIPQSMYPADSLYIRTSETEISQYMVKFLYYSQIPKNEFDTNIVTNYPQNTNSILYYLSSSSMGSNMKFQVASIIIDTSTKTVPSGTYMKRVVSGMTIRWAVDSLGNGLFHQSTSILTELKNSVMKAKTASCKFLKLNNSNHLSSKGTYVSLLGEKALKIKSKGIFIVRQ
jgi:hypothetical protein